MAPASRFVSYLRVSTVKQGAFGLGMNAQRAAVAQHVTAAGGNQVQEFVEVETHTVWSGHARIKLILTLPNAAKVA